MQSTKEPSAREKHILEAAFGVFARYGFARTTMADLANAAGLSRPALYLVYCGKAEVFHAVIDWFVERTLMEIRDTLDAAWPLERQLLHVAELSIARGFDILMSNPDAADLMSPERHGPAVHASFDRLRQLLADLLHAPAARARIGTTGEELAVMLMAAMKGFKIAAKDGQHLRQMIATQVRVTTAALGEGKRSGRQPPIDQVRTR